MAQKNQWKCLIVIGILILFTAGFGFGKFMFEPTTTNTKPLNHSMVKTNKPELTVKNGMESFQKEFMNTAEPSSKDASAQGELSNKENLPADKPAEQNNLPSQYPAVDPSVKRIDVVGGRGKLAYKGDETAPVPIIEFSDYQNQDCATYFKEIYPLLENEFIAKGIVKYFFRDYIVESGEKSIQAAEASRCANDQKKFWEYHDILLNNYKSINMDNLKSWAKDLGLNQEDFNKCLEKRTYEVDVKNDIADGEKSGVNKVPSFYINGKLLQYTGSFDDFKKLIIEELESIRPAGGRENKNQVN